MEQNHFTTNPSHQKGKHLNFEERVVIQTRLRDGWSFRKIAREIGCSVNTVRYSRGKVLLYIGKIERYRAEDGQSKYKANRENCDRKFQEKSLVSRCLCRSCSQARNFQTRRKNSDELSKNAKKINDREEFGHLECDLIVSNISDDDVL